MLSHVTNVVIKHRAWMRIVLLAFFSCFIGPYACLRNTIVNLQLVRYLFLTETTIPVSTKNVSASPCQQMVVNAGPAPRAIVLVITRMWAWRQNSDTQREETRKDTI